MAAKKKFNRYGWHPDLPDSRDIKYVPPMGAVETIPPLVDLRPNCPPIYNQGSLGSCTANAIGADLQFAQMRQGQPNWVPSRLFIYYNERFLENTIREDAGAMLRDGIKALVRWGFCPETDWAYDINKFANKPPQSAYKNAYKNKVQQYARIDQSLDYMRSCLAGGDTFFFGFTVYSSFESNEVSHSGIMPMPGRRERVMGGHAVLACGYDDAKRVFYVRNSWGDDWGDKGYFYMPYEFITNPDLADDFWTVTYVQ